MSSETTGSTGLAGRYTSALFELAKAEGILDRVAEDLDSLHAMIEVSEGLHRLIHSPVLSREEQGRAMDALMEKAETSDLTRRFIGVVAQNRRLFVLPGIIKDYTRRLAAYRGETSAEVISAAPLSDKQMEAIGASLKKTVGTDVTIEAKVDAALLGGLIVRVGSRMVDSTLRTKLQHLRLAMKGVG